MTDRAIVGGRPNLLSEDLIDVLCAHFSMGMSATDACALAGVNYQTYMRWMRIGRAIHEEDWNYPQIPDDPKLVKLYADLYERVPMAKAAPRRRAMMTIIKHASPRRKIGEDGRVEIVPGDLKAAQWVMEHTSADYAQTGITRHETFTEVTAEINVNVELDETDVEHARRVAAVLAQAGADAAAIGLLLPEPDVVDGQHFAVDEDSESAFEESIEIHSSDTD